MAKKLLLNVLLSVLGDYIEGLSEDNLKLGVWSGEISLNNLQLNRTILQKLNLPVIIAHGSVKSLLIKIPWATLESNPVRITIDGIYLQVGPLELSLLNAEDLTIRALAVKQYKLDEVEKNIERSFHKRGSSPQENLTYWQRLTTTILDNIEINLTNVHLRYEDSITLPGSCFSFGITLDNFSLSTRNKEWKESFVARTKGVDVAINKLANIQNFGIYWNSKSKILKTDKFNKWELEMQKYIYNDKLNMDLASFCDIDKDYPLEFILSPTNSLVVKIVHFETAPPNIPRLDVIVEITHLQLTLDKLQFLQLSTTVRLINTLDQQQQLLAHRPKSRPNKDPRSWWTYAVKLVCKNEAIFSNRIENIMFCMHARKRYIYLIKRKKEAALYPQDENNQMLATMSFLESEELNHLESILPLYTLAVFRRLAAMEEEIVVQVSGNIQPRNDVKPSWWNWLSEPETGVDIEQKEDDLDLNFIKEKLVSCSTLTNNMTENQKSAYLFDSVDAINFRLKLSSSASFHLNSNKNPVITLNMQLKFCLTAKSESIAAYLSIEDFLVVDNYTPNPVMENIVSIKSDFTREADLPFFSVDYQYHNNSKSLMKISALPLQLVLNEKCIRQIFSFFSTSHTTNRVDIFKNRFNSQEDNEKNENPTELSLSSKQTKSSTNTFGVVCVDLAAILSSSKHGLEVVFEAETPKIIVPENNTYKHTGFGLFDAGHLSIRGYVSFEGMVWDISLKSVNIGMPTTIENLYSHYNKINTDTKDISNENVYLIKPFDVSTHLQTINRSNSKMNIDIKVQPEIKGELDTIKLSRLMTIVFVIIKAFTMRADDALAFEDSSKLENQIEDDNCPNKNVFVSPAEFYQHLITVHAIIPKLELNLFYDNSNDQHLKLYLNELNVDVILRYFDMQIFCGYNNLIIEDTIQMVDERVLLFNERDTLSNDVQITYVSVGNKKSPLYQLYGSKLSLNFKHLNLNVDVSTLLHLQPFVHVLLGKNSKIDKERSSDVGKIPLHPKPKSDETVPKGLEILVVIHSVNLHLFRSSTDIHSNSTSLEGVYLIKADELFADIILHDLLNVDVSISSFEVVDTREASEEYIFKTIFSALRTNRDGSPFLSDIQKTPHKSNTNNLLSLTFKQESPIISNIDIILGDIFSTISLDVILDFVDVTVSNSFAILALLDVKETPLPLQESSHTPSIDLELHHHPSVDISSAINNYSIDTLKKPQENETHMGTINLAIKSKNFVAILLDDPTKSDSRAIATCVGQVEVHYHRDTTQISRDRNILESLHVSVRSLQTSMLINICKWTPMQILEPFGLEFHLGRKLSNDILFSSNISLDIDSIDARVSFQDIMLLKSIMTQRTRLVADSKKNSSLKKNTLDVEPENYLPVQMTAYSFSISLGKVNTVIINDFNKQNLPVFQLIIDRSIVNIDGITNQLQGVGESAIAVNFYNSHISSWEPLLEYCQHELKYDVNSNGTTLVLKFSNILQVNLTGFMLERLLQTYSVLLSLDEDSVNDKREEINDISVKNLLGINIFINESSNNKFEFELKDGETKALDDFDSLETNKSLNGMGMLRNLKNNLAVNVSFDGLFGRERAPILHLSFNISHPLLHTIQPVETLVKNNADCSYFDPIIEDIYENERYDPIHAKWLSPFLPGDFSASSDYHGFVKLKKDVILPSGWEWQGDWKVDLLGNGNTELDAEGFAYHSIFNGFVSPTLHRKKRLSGDCVRRRRWVRTRQPIPASLYDPTRPLITFWEVKSHVNGSKMAILRSHLQIENNMPFPMLVSLRCSAWVEDVQFGPINEGDTFTVPLIYAYASGVRFRPAFLDNNWSTIVGCAIQPHNYKSLIDLVCDGYNNYKPVCLRASFKQSEKSILIKCLPFMILTNKLPCSFAFRLFSGQELIQDGKIKPGKCEKLANIDLAFSPSISFKIGDYLWSKLKLIHPEKYQKSFIEFYADEKNNLPELILTISSKEGKTGSVEVEIYSRAALIDSTGLRLNIISQGRNGVNIHRKTCEEFSSINISESELSNQNIIVHKSSLNIMNFPGDNFEFSNAQPGSNVYTDSNIFWKYHPPNLIGHLSIKVPNHIRGKNTKSFASFSCDSSIIMVVLNDKKSRNIPKWVRDGKFRKIFGQSVALDPDSQGEIFYDIHAKIVPENEIINIPGVNSNETNMVSIIILPITSLISNQIQLSDTDIVLEAESAWCHGNNGITLFDTDNGRFSIGLKSSIKGPFIWSSDLQINNSVSAISSKTPFEITGETAVNGKRCKYLLAFKVSSWPGAFYRTECVTVISRYCIVNCTDEALDICQDEQYSSPTTILPYDTKGWHLRDDSKGTNVKFRLHSTGWTVGNIDINDIGTSVLLLPTVITKIPVVSNDDVLSSVPTSRHTILHIEVKIAEQHENCMITVVIWKASTKSDSIYSIKNESDLYVTVRQAVTMKDTSSDMFDIVVPPKSWLPFGWINQNLGTKIIATVGKKISSSNTKIATLDFLKVDRKLRLPFTQALEVDKSYKEVVVSVEASEFGRILKFTPYQDLSDKLEPIIDTKKAHFTIQFEIELFGVSLILERPTRREFLTLYAHEVSIVSSQINRSSSIALSVENIQIDNYSETAIYPVFLCGGPKFEKNQSVTVPKPSVIEFFLKCEIPEGSSTVICRYLALRILLIRIQVDSASLHLLYSDLIKGVRITTREEAHAISIPYLFIEELNLKLMSLSFRKQMVDIYGSKESTRASKLYIEKLVMHPIKLLLTFTQTPFPRKQEFDENISYAILNILTTLAGVDDMELKLNSFIVSGVMESVLTLRDRILAKVFQDLQSQIGQVAGSLAVIGSPIGLARNIGEGLHDFFYEPIQGAMESPQSLLIGIGKGTTSLFQGVITGALNSTTAIAETAGTGLSFLSGDADFIRKRANQRQIVHASSSGIFQGLITGTDNIVSGISSGVSGLFMRPIEEAQSDGVAGFFRGIGLGVLGAAVKPVLGVADGISTIAKGLSTEVGNKRVYQRRRSSRTFERSNINDKHLVLVDINLDAILAQNFVKERAKNHKFEDSFVKFFRLSEDEFIVLSEVYLYWKRKKGLWGRTWSDISHIVFLENAIGIMLYTSASSSETVSIDCFSREKSVELYSILATNSFRMGNPANIIPVELIDQKNEKMGEISGSYLVLHKRAVSLAGEFNGYRFGTYNGESLEYVYHDEQEVIGRARKLVSNLTSKDTEQLDKALWNIIWEWDCTHRGLNPARCLALLIVNNSPTSVHITRTELRMGKNYIITGAPEAFYEHSRTIAPKCGYVLLFLWGFNPSPLEIGHIFMNISTSAFIASIGSRPRESFCNNQSGYTTGFLEKTVSEWWSKFVIVIN